MIRWMIRDAPGRRKATEEAANDKLPVGLVKLIQFILWVQLILCGALEATTAARKCGDCDEGMGFPPPARRSCPLRDLAPTVEGTPNRLADATPAARRRGSRNVCSARCRSMAIALDDRPDHCRVIPSRPYIFMFLNALPNSPAGRDQAPGASQAGRGYGAFDAVNTRFRSFPTTHPPTIDLGGNV